MQKTVVFNNKEISYRVKGEGQPIVLIHGFAEISEVWKNQLHAFPEKQLIIPDLPGTGKSPLAEDMSIEGMADAVHAVVMQELKSSLFSSVFVCGHSMGGYVTLAFVDKYPQLVKGYCLFHSSAYADSKEKKETREKGIAFIREHGAQAFLKTMIPNLYGPQTKKDAPERIEEHLQGSAGFSPESLVTYYQSMMKRPDRTGILQLGKTPVLFILGRHDSAVPLEDGLKQSHLPNVSYVHILESSGHMGMIEETEMANSYLKKFFADLDKE